MKKDNLVIFGFQRSATKLVASILEQGGYFSHGEFFDVYSCELIGETAIRLPFPLQQSNSKILREYDSLMIEYYRTAEARKRMDIFRTMHRHPKSVVTVFSEEMCSLFDLYQLLSDRYFLCTRRANKLEQVLSLLVTKTHRNFNDEFKSTPITVNIPALSRYLSILYKTELFQDSIVESGNGEILDFDSIISGAVDFGFPYTIQTSDQHDDIKSLITNIDEVQRAYDALTLRYQFGRDVKTADFSKYIAPIV